jgi:iron complex outermembrane receptor protein
MKKSLALLFLLFFNIIISQQDTTDLKEVVVSTTKLEIPFSKNFRTVKIISSDYIKNSPASNVSDLLQEITGIDVRRRGVRGCSGRSLHKRRRF